MLGTPATPTLTLGMRLVLRVVVSFDNANSNYNIICQEGTLSVGQDAPVETTNYQVSEHQAMGMVYESDYH